MGQAGIEELPYHDIWWGNVAQLKELNACRLNYYPIFHCTFAIDICMSHIYRTIDLILVYGEVLIS